MIRNYIFDIDGTLLDSECIFYNSLDYALRCHNIHPAIPTHGLFGLTVDETLERLNIPLDCNVRITWEKRFDELCSESNFYDGIPDVFHTLRKRNARIVIVTSRSHTTVNSICHNSMLSPYIELCIAAEDTARHKPHPDPIILAMTTLDLRPDQTIYIGDTINDYTAALGAGVSFAAAAWNGKASSLPGLQLRSPFDLLHIQ